MTDRTSWHPMDAAAAPAPPAHHLAPPSGWMNDPNGLVVIDGLYHAFYQHNPHADVWGPMHWRHATSPDLLVWTDHGVALAPDTNGWIFSGSAVVDHHNSSGLAPADGPGPVVAVFTHHLGAEDGTYRQSQSLAYSLDRGWTWYLDPANPVLATGRADHRDPKVWRYRGPDGSWWMMAVAAGDHIEFHRSRDLRHWTMSGEFGASFPGSGAVWECPDLVVLHGPDGSSEVLLVSTSDAGPQGHSGVVAIPGRFDGAAFRASGPGRRLDHGPDFYAVQSFANRPGPPVVLAWMNSWSYAPLIPSQGRRGVLSCARQLGPGRFRALAQAPIVPPAIAHRPTSGPVRPVPGRPLALTVRGLGQIAVDGRSGTAVEVAIGAGTMTLTRPDPAGSGTPVVFDAERLTAEPVRLVIDHGTIEVFADGGETVMSAQIFPGPEWELQLEADADLDIPADLAPSA